MIHRFIRGVLGKKKRHIRTYDALQAQLTEVIRLAYEGIDPP